MLVRDILPPSKTAAAGRVVRENVLGLKPDSSRRSNLLRLVSRAVLFLALGLLAAWQDSGRALGYEEILGSVQEGIAELGEGIAAGVGGLLNLDRPEEMEQFATLRLETPAAGGGADAPSAPAAASTGRMKFAASSGADGRTRFEMKSLAGDNIEFADDALSGRPYLKSERWGGETSLRIDIPQAAGGRKELNDNRIRSRGGRYQVEVYAREPETVTEVIAGMEHSFALNEEGGVEFDLVLQDVPADNVFEFPVESAGLTFYYQDALHPEHPTWADLDGDGTADFFRPEAVVGSYAVYRTGEEGALKTEEAGAKYKTGKAFHIYRPRVTDSSGQQVWGELGYDPARRVLSVTVPAEWLAGARYPVRVDPNIGTTSVGASASSISSSNNIISNGAIAGANGNVTSMSAYVRRPTAGSMKCNIYNSTYYPLHSSGTANGAIPSTAAWVTMAFTAGPDISSAENYYLAIWNQYSYYLYADSTTSHTSLLSAVTWGGAWPSPSGTTTLMPVNYSLYATYVESKLGPPGMGISGGGMMMF